ADGTHLTLVLDHGDADVSGSAGHRDLQLPPILLGHERKGRILAGDVDGRAAAEDAAADHTGADFAGRECRDRELDLALVQKDPRPDLRVASELRMIDRRLFTGRGDGPYFVEKRKWRAHLERHGTLDRRRAGPDLSPGKVEQEGDLAAELTGGGADDPGLASSKLSVLVRQVEAEPLRALSHHLLDDLGLGGSLPDRSDDADPSRSLGVRDQLERERERKNAGSDQDERRARV